MSTQPTTPFGATGRGTPSPAFKQRPAIEYGGGPGIGLISIMTFLKAVNRLEGDLEIEYATGSMQAISRETNGVEEPAGNKNMRAAEKHFGIDGYDPRYDSPPIEIRATFTPYSVLGGTDLTSTPAPGPIASNSHEAVMVNAADYFREHDAAFYPEPGDQTAQLAWLMKWHHMTSSEAAEFLALGVRT